MGRKGGFLCKYSLYASYYELSRLYNRDVLFRYCSIDFSLSSLSWGLVFQYFFLSIAERDLQFADDIFAVYLLTRFTDFYCVVDRSLRFHLSDPSRKACVPVHPISANCCLLSLSIGASSRICLGPHRSL